jgi:enoyl-CoA hydratase/carnithine racemase
VSDLVTVTDKDGIRVIRMNRPDKKNALTAEMYAALAAAVANADAPVRCLVIGGVPGAFTAGNDLQDFLAAARGGALDLAVVGFLHALARNAVPVVAAVQGVAVGIGTTMLLHCDHVVAGRDARFSTPFVSLGLVPEGASSLLAPRLMGQRRAFGLLVMGETLDAEAARACGLVNTIVAPEETDAAALKAAERIAALPPQAVAASRRLMRGAPDEIVARIDEEARVFAERLKSPEARTALEAFFNRRK